MSSEAEAERVDHAVEPPGKRLRAAREAAGLGQNDVAAELRLGVDTVNALEHDAVERLPAPIFVRGYLRNYAALVGLPAQELVDAYNGSVGRGLSQGLMAGPVQQQLIGARRRSYLGWLLVLVVAVAAGWWFQQRTAEPPEDDMTAADPAPTQSSALRQGDDDLTGRSSDDDPSGRMTEEQSGLPAVPAPQSLPPQAEPVTPPPEDVAPSVEQPVTEAAPEPTPDQADGGAVESKPEPAPAPQAQPVGDTLVLVFSERSWVEVRDATGERLLYRLANAGESRTLQGKAPFQLVLGNAPAVRVELNGSQVDVAAHTTGRTARFAVAP